MDEKKLDFMIDISEENIRNSMPEILDILLIDRTTTTPKKINNIIWANDNYQRYGFKQYAPTAQITADLITGTMDDLIKPRALKSNDLKKERTKSKAEVFTPSWIVKKQNDAVDENYTDDSLEKYVSRKWLEITCGEAPYMVSRYEMESGELIPIEDRVGFVDRKLRRINKEVSDKAEWQRLVEFAYQSSYGFEWSGDSLLLARENLLYTYRDYYVDKWEEEPLLSLFLRIANIISFNVFQMDGLKYIIPLSERIERIENYQLSLFDDEISEEFEVIPGKRVKIMNWETNKMEYFDKGLK